jgi:outer membrane protein OmpA-like peptidoglycan-associated protein
VGERAPYPSAGASAAAPALNPYFGLPQSNNARPVSTVVELRCELTPRPRLGALHGHVVAPDGMPVVGASAKLIGGVTLDMTTDSQGEISNTQVPAGSYQLRIEAEGYLLRQLNLQINPTQTTNAEVALVPKPKEAQVELTKEEVRIRKQIFFKSNSAEIDAKSDDLLSEIADVLLRNPQVTLVEIQGHTDNKGGSELNKALSQARAEAVRTWLTGHGIEENRLTAIGYGDSRPLLPNITERNRARNRRVQFIIREPKPQ